MMPRAPKVLKSEDDVKALVKKWFDDRGAWSYAPVQNGLGVHGIHDRIGCVPITITQEMVGKQVGLFVSIECKRPGRRGEKDRGMTPHQAKNVPAINEAKGFSICCDGHEDLEQWNVFLTRLMN